tara:strand:- start:1919 stop:2581 length:663 start_codon:yes stop_codon:yes gene_type:complete
MKKYVTYLTTALLLSVCAFSSNAALIVNNSFLANDLELTESFEDFYDYGNLFKASSNTGFELNNTLVLMIVSFDGDFGLVGLMDKLDSTGGGMTIALTDDSTTQGAFTLYDDPKETGTTSGNTITSKWNWGEGFTDGFVYTFGDITDVDVTLDFTIKSGISDIVFYDFDGSTQLINVTGPNLSLSNAVDPTLVSVSTPNSMLITILALSLLLMRKFKTKS